MYATYAPNAPKSIDLVGPNVLLLKPPQLNQSVYHIMPPIGIGYVASAIRNHCKQVEILDCICDNISFDKLINIIHQKHPDLIGITMLSHDIPMVKRITEAIKTKISKNIIIIVGGAHPSAAPEHTMKALPNTDFAFKGEAETGFLALLQTLRQYGRFPTDQIKKIPGLVYRHDGDIFVNPQHFEENLDRFGMPAWDLIDPRKYFKTCHGVFYKKHRFAPLFATRGCPHFCAFCAAHVITGRSIRKRSVEHIINEIKYLQDTYDIEEFHFLDDDITDDRDFIMALCDGLIAHKLNIAWTCPNGVRIDSLTAPILERMKLAGCYSLFVAIESGSQETLNRMRKGLRINEVTSKMHLIKKFGFTVTGFFIIGFPGETREDIKKTIDFALSLPLDIADFSNFLPLPGSAITDRSYGEDAVSQLNYERLSSPAHTTNSAIETEAKRVQRSMLRAAYLRFYLRWHIIAGMILRIRSPYQLYFLFKRVYAYIITRN